VHREHQRGDEAESVRGGTSGTEANGARASRDILPSERPLVDALAALYAYVYGVPEDDVRLAAEQRALAMRYSDQWVRDGCKLESWLIPAERAALVRSYAGLLAAVHLPARL
jgi:hypothetical protein